MAKKRIILLSDGTGNSAGKVWRTNVWRVFESLDLTSSEQIAFYDDGVGTSSFKPFAILGGAFGFGLKRNALDIYKFACRNYCSHLDYLEIEAARAKAEKRDERYGPWQNDDIFGFGFSRGAFTMRVVNGLICEQGLVRYGTEEELDDKVAAAYRQHRAESFKSKFQVEWLFRLLRNIFVPSKHDKNERPVDYIAFLGLWDTVAAYGLPVDEMTRGVSRYLWPLELPDRQLNRKVRKACHALALDDERTTFHPLLWDESPETAATGTRPTSAERISQVWFAGVHSNVGGGYPDDSLAHVSLTWMLSEARQRGLTLKAAPGADPDAFTRVCSTQDKDGRIYDSRNGLGGYYRYGPRSVAALSNTDYSDDKRDCVHIAVPKIHQSVFERIAVDAHLYAPVGLPQAYEVLTYDERIVSPDNLRGETPEAAHRFESAASARGREETQEKAVGSSIWRRRIIYFLTVIASIYLLAYPIASQLPPSAEYTTRLRPLSDVIRMVEIALPHAATRWTNNYARDPLHFLLAAGMVALLMWLSAGLKDRITDQMRSAWRRSLSKYDVHADTRPPSAGAGVLLNVVYACLLLIVLYPIPAWLGFPLPKLVEPLQILIDRATEPYFRILAFVVLVTMFLPDRTIAWFRLKDGYKQAISNFKLWIAPAFFALAFLVGGIALAGHYLFNVRDSFGNFCLPDPDAKPLEICRPRDLEQCDRDAYGNFPAACTPACRGVEIEFDTRRMCTSTKVMVSTNGRYHFQISKKDDWSFLGGKSGPGGALLPKKNETWSESAERWSRTAMLAVAYPIKRTFDRPFGRVILRFGETGNEENFIDPSEDDLLANKLEETVKATREGEMYVYLNKPVSGFWPGLFDNVNSGTARVRVYRVPRTQQ
ncbi:MAG: DUF2235 domain-containing protein [Bradyrhizobium icense]|nr:MAG: DUF2235 domain-containing protein [Bradyrhizobium icense]